MNSLLRDVRYGLRMLRKRPGFTALAILTLALGIGSATAIFSVVNGVLLRSLPYPHAARLMVLTEATDKRPEISVAWPNYQDWRAQNHTFEELAAFSGGVFNLTGAGEPERLESLSVTANYFSALGARVAAGRLLTADDVSRRGAAARGSARVLRAGAAGDASGSGGGLAVGMSYLAARSRASCSR